MKSPPLQYLYYITQIGLHVSPLSNNALFLDYHDNPYPKMFKRGLSVSLSTDDPLQFHHTEQPLLEEYSVCAQRWNFDDTDLCEMARNSVLHSGFEHNTKQMWLGADYHLGTKGNDISFSNVPNIRLKFRDENLMAELNLLTEYVASGNED